MADERWMPVAVPGYERLYDVSDQGRVRSRRGRVIKQWRNGAGERRVQLYNVHKPSFSVPLLVLTAFVGQPPAGVPSIIHLDGDLENNRVENLKWTIIQYAEIPGERWRPVLGYEETYDVSDHGRVLWRRGGLKAQGFGSAGYPTVALQKGGVAKTYHVHRLVLEAFAGPRPPGMECRHLDGDRTNNHISNLVWGTNHENLADRRLHGTIPFGERAPGARLTEQQVREVLSSPEIDGAEFGRRFGVSDSAIHRIRNGRTWRHIQRPPTIPAQAQASDGGAHGE